MTGTQSNPINPELRSHHCTGPGCPGCYSVANSPRFERVELSEYEKRIQDRWERGER